MPRRNYMEGGLEIEPVSSPPDDLKAGEAYLDDGTNTSSGLPGWRYLVSTGPDTFGDASSVTGSIDATAIHKTTADEFDTAALKPSPVSADRVLLEDSEDSLNKKYATVGTLPGGGGSALTVEEEGTPVDTDTTTLNFTGTGATASQTVAGEVQVDIPGETPLVVEDEGTPVDSDVGTIDFAGAGVTVTQESASNVLVTIPGGGGGGVGGEDSNLWAHPATPHVADDEFDSGTLDTAWKVHDGTSDVVGAVSINPVDAYDQSFNTGSDLRIELHGSARPSWIITQPPSTKRILLYKAYTFPANVLIISRFKFNIGNSTTPNNDRNISLGVWANDGGTPKIATDYAVNYLNESDASTQANYILHDNGIKLVDFETTDTQLQGQAFEYIAIHKIGTTYHGWVGTSGGNWIWMGSSSIALALAYVGFSFENQSLLSPGVGVFGVDFIRFIETDNFLF